MGEGGMINVHNHTTWSDGRHTVVDVLKYAEGRLRAVGICDHYETRKTPSISRANLARYVEEVRKAAENYMVRVLVGIEIDFSGRTDIEHIPWNVVNEMDFVLFEYVNDRNWGGRPFWEFLNVIKRAEIPVGLSHPDLGRCYHEVDRERFLRVLEVNGVMVELNTSRRNTRMGMPYYRLASDFFECMRDYDVPLAVGTDTHEKLEDVVAVRDAYDFVDELRLQDKIEICERMLGLR